MRRSPQARGPMNVNWFELAYSVIGGLSVFLFGMKALSDGLQALASDFMRRVIGWLTTNTVLAVIVGTVVTVIIQSSSVTTVMVVGFVNAGLMSLAQAIGVILGANIGTTVTGWIVALKIGKYGLLFLGLGLAPYFFVKSGWWKAVGQISIALGFIFLGLDFMSGGFKPLTKEPDFAGMLTFFAANNLLSVLACVAVGCGLTFIVQSSSAMLGITIALATTAAPGGHPVIGLATAVALVLGENIGTTITAQLASIGANVVAKRAAMAHTLFNVLGVSVVVLIFDPFMMLVDDIVGPSFEALSGLFHFSAVHESFAIVGFKIAAAHSLFNVTNVLLFLPFVPQLARITERLRPDTGQQQKNRLKLLGDVSLLSPELALQQAEGELHLACDVTEKLFAKTAQLVEQARSNPTLKQEIDHSEGITDNIQMEVTLFLTNVLQTNVTHAQASRAYALIRLADEVESVGDYCQSLAGYEQRLHEQGSDLTPDARAELMELIEVTQQLFRDACTRVAQEGERVEVDDLLQLGERLREKADSIRSAHLERIKEGRCNAIAGLTFSDMVVALRRIKNHTINMLEARNSTWEDRFTHNG